MDDQLAHLLHDQIGAQDDQGKDPVLHMDEAGALPERHHHRRDQGDQGADIGHRLQDTRQQAQVKGVGQAEGQAHQGGQ